MNTALCAVALAMLSSASAKDFECPNNDYGWYGDPENCIRYFHCSLGVSEEYLCPISELVAIAFSSLLPPTKTLSFKLRVPNVYRKMCLSVVNVMQCQMDPPPTMN